MKKALILPLLVIANMSVAGQLHNFNQVSAAIATGNTIHIATDFTKCTSSKSIPQAVNQMGIFTPNEMQLNNTSIASSLLHFTMNDPAYPGTPVYEYVRYTINQDNTLTIDAQVLAAQTFSTYMIMPSISCKLDTGAKIFS